MRLQKHETNLLESLLLWQAEVDKILERMDVCPVCLSYTTSEGHLPSKKCYQCKHQFHGNSGSSPLTGLPVHFAGNCLCRTF
ncbi:hypothetical protein D917_08220 [Trichinella nativa]|uniref:Uncharacterized protein n=1 Tax=Trichinella nativa TaxID=6335 RepID=A0A1Y3EPK0_9BILA|nr:hypothetical protein D917_08220 [Trichinella nativa]